MTSRSPAVTNLLSPISAATADVLTLSLVSDSIFSSSDASWMYFESEELEEGSDEEVEEGDPKAEPDEEEWKDGDDVGEGKSSSKGFS
jgi:hypothetical protein